MFQIWLNIIILVLLIIIIFFLFSQQHIEKYVSTEEAIDNLASLYNQQKLTVSNANVTQELLVEGEDILKELNFLKKNAVLYNAPIQVESNLKTYLSDNNTWSGGVVYDNNKWPWPGSPQTLYLRTPSAVT